MSEIKKKVLLLVETEYQMMVALSAIADLYNDPTKFDIALYQIQSEEKRRFQNTNPPKLPNLIYRVLPYSDHNLDFNGNLSATFDEILAVQYDIFIFFNEHTILAVYMAELLSRQGAHVILAPDGMKAYDNRTRLSPRWSFKFAMRHRYFIKSRGLSVTTRFRWPTLRYAYMKEVKEIWVPSVAHYVNWNKKNVSEVKVMETPASAEMVRNFFRFDATQEMPITEKVIFLICLPPKFERGDRFNIHLIKTLQQRFPDYTMMVKLHPSSSGKQLADLQKLPNCILIKSESPAELYIATLKNSIVLSYWSSASTIKNATCRFYWLYNVVLKERWLPTADINIINPTDHIVMVNSIDEIK